MTTTYLHWHDWKYEGLLVEHYSPGLMRSVMCGEALAELSRLVYSGVALPSRHGLCSGAWFITQPCCARVETLAAAPIVQRRDESWRGQTARGWCWKLLICAGPLKDLPVLLK